MTDVWTSAGVVLGVAAVGITGGKTLDPLIALAVAANIVVTGVRLLMRCLPGELTEQAALEVAAPSILGSQTGPCDHPSGHGL